MKKLLCSIMIFAISSSAIPVFASQNDNLGISTNTTLEEVSPKGIFGMINSNNVHFRSQPGLNTSIHGQLHYGYRVVLTKTKPVSKDGIIWKEVIYNNITGWVASQYIIQIN